MVSWTQNRVRKDQETTSPHRFHHLDQCHLNKVLSFQQTCRAMIIVGVSNPTPGGPPSSLICSNTPFWRFQVTLNAVIRLFRCV